MIYNGHSTPFPQYIMDPHVSYIHQKGTKQTVNPPNCRRGLKANRDKRVNRKERRRIFLSTEKY